jgi:hypothetical protein
MHSLRGQMDNTAFIPFISFFIWMIILIILSFFVDYLLARIFSKGAHRFFVFLGVIVHEYSHAFGCLITRTKIKEIKLFEETGGHVTHEKRNPLITAIIGMMPLFGCSVFLFILAWLFQQIGVSIDTSEISISGTDFLNSFWQILIFAGTTFYNNFVPFDIVRVVFFILFLYFVGSVAACIAPSGTDLKHSIIGMIFIFILGMLTIYLQPLKHIPGVLDEFQTSTPVLDFIIKYLSIAIGIGLIGVILILLILIPVALLKKR